MQAFMGSLVGHGSTKSAFFITSSFSIPTMDYVCPQRQRATLIDRSTLADLMTEQGLRVSRAVELNNIDLNCFEPD
ncbi:restriction endonuclease [Gluconobacter cerevisiae]|nr:restriction endonuclease [Gluconobacter cerevisiae]